MNKELLESKGFKEYEITDEYIRYKKDSDNTRWWFLYHFKSTESVLDSYILEKCRETNFHAYFAETLYDGKWTIELEEIIRNVD